MLCEMTRVIGVDILIVLIEQNAPEQAFFSFILVKIVLDKQMLKYYNQ